MNAAVPEARMRKHKELFEEASDEAKALTDKDEEMQKLEQEVADLKQVLQKLEKDHLYVRAEVQNQNAWFQKRLYESALENRSVVVRDLLHAFNSLLFLHEGLQTALTSKPSSFDVLMEVLSTSCRSIEMILEEFNKLGLQSMDESEIHQVVNPRRHEVIQTIQGDQKQDHRIASVVARGFIFEDRVLQKAKVIAFRYDPNIELADEESSSHDTTGTVTEHGENK